jgi:hypothetical protein
MTNRSEKLVKKEVTYTLLMGDQFFIIENVPARVDIETGEQFFAPETVEHLQQIIQSGKKPVRTVETPIYNFARISDNMNKE